MKIYPAHGPTTPLKSGWTTGQAWRQELSPAEDLRSGQVLILSFAPGARTHWHTHPRGQVLHVLSGIGRIQKDGEPIQEMKPGETVIIAADEKHWHGAGPETLFTHLAVQEIGPDGQATHWLEPVTDAQYAGL